MLYLVFCSTCCSSLSCQLSVSVQLTDRPSHECCHADETLKDLIMGAIMTCHLSLSPRRNVRAAIKAARECCLHVYQMYRAPSGRVEDGVGEGASGMRSPCPHCTAQLTHIFTPVTLQTGQTHTLLRFCGFSTNCCVWNYNIISFFIHSCGRGVLNLIIVLHSWI